MGKRTVVLALALGTMVMLSALFLIAWPDLGYQPLGLALALAAIAGFSGIGILYSRKQHRSLLQTLKDVDNRVSRVEYRTEPVHDIRGSVAKTSAGMRETLAQLRELASHADAEATAGTVSSAHRSENRSQPVEESIFAPGSIPASAIRNRPTMHTPGRDAARQEMNVPGEHNLARLLLAAETDVRREVAYIGGQDLIPYLEAVGTVTVITPGMGETAMPAAAAYLVIDIATLSETPWSGVLDASRTRLFQELRSIVLSARKKGVAVVTHGEDVPSHFTASLEDLAHVRVEDDGLRSTRWGDDVSSAVIDAVAAYASRTKTSPSRTTASPATTTSSPTSPSPHTSGEDTFKL